MAETEKRIWVYGYLSYFKGFEKTFSKKGETDPKKKAFRTNIIIDPEDPKGKKSIKKIEAMVEFIEAEVKMKPGKYYKLHNQRRFYWPAGEYLNAKDETPAGYEGKAALRLSNRKRIVFRDVDGVSPLVEEDGKFESGTYVKALISGYGIAPSDDERGGAAIYATVEAIQYLKKGLAGTFGGGGVSDSDFEDESENFDDDDEDEAPKAKKSKSRASDDDDDEDEAPKAKKKKRPVEDDDDEDDEDEAPKAKKKKKPVDDEDDEDDEDERPVKKKAKKKPVDDEDDDIEY